MNFKIYCGTCAQLTSGNGLFIQDAFNDNKHPHSFLAKILYRLLDFSKVKIAFFAAGSAIAEKWAHIAAEKTIVIDNSKFFRKDPDIPLVVPEVNAKELVNVKNKNIIANANCSVIPLVVALKPLHDLYNVKRIVVSTYQSVSGAGKDPMDELLNQTQDFFQNKKLESKYFTKQIAFNAILHEFVITE